MKILWHERIDEAQLDIFAELVHMFLHIFGDASWICRKWGGVVADPVVDWGSAFSRVVCASAPWRAAICCFLATILGAVSRYFAVEALIILHEFLFLGFGVLVSSATGGIDVHMISSLRGHAIIWFGWFLVV